MDSSALPFDVEAVLAHDRYVRRLARSLLRDGHAADDVTQQTWLATLLGRPRGPSVRGWLTATVRNLAAKVHVAELRRRKRERLAARPEALPSAAGTEAHEPPEGHEGRGASRSRRARENGDAGAPASASAVRGP